VNAAHYRTRSAHG